MIAYKLQLDRKPDWALHEASMHFEEKSAVHDSLQRIAARLDDLGIPYVIVGGMAMFAHGFRRFTEGVDLLVTLEGLKSAHDRLDGLGYVPPFPNSKQLRDAETGVRIEFLVTGQFPGDGKPKPVAFPDPATCGVDIGGIRYLQLPKLVELKLASGMTNPGRLKDLADVQELIRVLKLPSEYGQQLNPYVLAKFDELWASVQGGEESEG